MLHLLLVIHNHQPLGNLPDVFRKAYDIAYKPFLDVVKRHPGIRWALHSSGCLWEWMDANEPGYVDALKAELHAGRLELLTGGMWEPVQPLIDENAFRHQFGLMESYLKKRFGVVASGSWTTERVWEPVLPGRLASAGVRYTLLDDSQLRAGLPDPSVHQVWGYYRTEHNGRSVAIFPINERLRYLIPFRKADEVVGNLERMAKELPDNAAVTYGDDGEKFGMWPHTYEWVYEQGWLDDFLARIERSKVIRTIHPSEYMKLMPHPRQRVYVTTSSYREMGVWNLYPGRNLAAEKIYEWVKSNPELDRVEPPHVAGMFRTFLARYPESRYMHERVQEIIRLVHDRDPDVKPSDGSKASPTARALWHALRAQCNCAYWHGVFGGLYLNYLRFAVHREVLAAETELRRAKPSFPLVRYVGTRFAESRSRKEKPDEESQILVAARRVQWVIDPMTGQVISAGSLEGMVDVIDVLARRKEAYHATMKEASETASKGSPASIHDIQEVAPAGWREGHGYDKSRRGCFADRILAWAPSLDQLARVEHNPILGPEWGFWATDADERGVRLLKTDGPWRREKAFTFEEDGRVGIMRYSLSRDDGGSFKGVLLMEFNLGLLAGDSDSRYYLMPSGERRQLMDSFEIPEGRETACVDEWTKVKIKISVPDAEWVGAYPVKTLSRGEGGLEMTYQGTSALFRVPVKLEEGGKFRVEARMEVRSIE